MSRKTQPWSVWWDFRSENCHLKWVVVQTDHPDYKDVDYIYRFPLESCTDETGTIDF